MSLFNESTKNSLDGIYSFENCFFFVQPSYAKHLIEDTIRRNASPVRLDGTASGIGAAVSCSSLASSNSDEVQPRISRPQTQHKVRAAGGSVLLHSLSTNDASLGEYKYTVNVGQHSIKITGDNIELVRVWLKLSSLKCQHFK